MSTLISRDPVARTELRRVVWPVTTGTMCSWCGNGRRSGRPHTLFKYVTETDGGRTIPHSGLFCSKPCHNIYRR